jgi:hypothetical protein
MLPWSSGAGSPAVWVRFARYMPSFSRWRFEMKLSSLRPKEMKRVLFSVVSGGGSRRDSGGGGGRGNRRLRQVVGVHRGCRVDC